MSSSASFLLCAPDTSILVMVRPISVTRLSGLVSKTTDSLRIKQHRNHHRQTAPRGIFFRIEVRRTNNLSDARGRNALFTPASLACGRASLRIFDNTFVRYRLLRIRREHFSVRREFLFRSPGFRRRIAGIFFREARLRFSEKGPQKNDRSIATAIAAFVHFNGGWHPFGQSELHGWRRKYLFPPACSRLSLVSRREAVGLELRFVWSAESGNAGATLDSPDIHTNLSKGTSRTNFRTGS